MNTIKAYWFEPANGVLQYGDGRKPVVGETHEIEGEPKLCKNGLHGSVRALDALKYAASNNIWIVELSGEVDIGDDKIAATKRKYIKRIAAEKILFECPCRFALSLAHLWDMPEVVRKFLETGDLTLRAAARDAAWDAWDARAAARDAWAAWAARAAAWAAARAAAWDARAAWDAWDAAWDAWDARDAAWDARDARDAARDAAWDAQNTLLEALIEREANK